MTERRALVIGSQCAALSTLDFIPEYAEQLYTLLTDARLGSCTSALPGRSGLVIDPTFDVLSDVIAEAVSCASTTEAMLIIAFIGHATSRLERNLYLLPIDGRDPPDMRSGYLVGQQLLKLFEDHHSFDGMLLLLDVCYGGLATIGAPLELRSQLTNTRFELLAAVVDRPAAGGCFTKELIKYLRSGDPYGEQYLLAPRVRDRLAGRCGQQDPVWDAIHGGQARGDVGLWLAPNSAISRRWPLAGTAGAGLAEQLVQFLLPTDALAKLVTATRRHRLVVVEGVSGSGKSTLVSALAQPTTAGVDEVVPAAMHVHALAFSPLAPTPETLADILAEQLARTVDGFSKASEEYRQSQTQGEWGRLDAFTARLVGPLRQLQQHSLATTVRLVVDGWDQLPAPVRHRLESALNDLSGPTVPRIHLIVTTRPGVPIPAARFVLQVPAARQSELRAYFERRDLAKNKIASLARVAHKNWLIARLIGDIVTTRGSGLNQLPATLNEVYGTVLDGAASHVAQHALAPVLSVLSATVSGPVLPLSLLSRAVRLCGSSESVAVLRDVLVDLGGLVVRSYAGTDHERVGPFHVTFVDYLNEFRPFGIDPLMAHRVLSLAIEELAPAQSYDPTNVQHQLDPQHQYAYIAEANHYWALGQYAAALNTVRWRESHFPMDNLYIWRDWHERARRELGSTDPITLRARAGVAEWTGRAGDAQRAVRSYQQLLNDINKIFGHRSPEALRVCNSIAYWTGQSGNIVEAMRLARKLLPAMDQVLGSFHPETLGTRSNLAHWTGVTGDSNGALRLLRALLPDRQYVLGPNHVDTLATRGSIASWMGIRGQISEALRLLKELLPDQKMALGPHHPATLATRANIASWFGESGHPKKAAQLFEELLRDQASVLGDYHPDTLATRANIAVWIGEGGDADAALGQLNDLLVDRIRVLGRDHPATLVTRAAIGHWTGRIGDISHAVKLFEHLISQQEERLGINSPETLRSRSNMAHWIGESGDVQAALKLLRDLLPTMEMVLGRTYPETLTIRNNMAYWLGESGDKVKALQSLQTLLPVQKRVLGSMHRHTLKTRHNIANLSGEVNGAASAVRLLQILLRDQKKALMYDHPDTLTTRNNLASWTGRNGDIARAIRLLEDVLLDMVKVLGRKSPETIATRSNLAYWTARNGDTSSAMQLLEEVIPDMDLVFGPNNPTTRETRLSITLLRQSHKSAVGATSQEEQDEPINQRWHDSGV